MEVAPGEALAWVGLPGGSAGEVRVVGIETGKVYVVADGVQGGVQVIGQRSGHGSDGVLQRLEAEGAKVLEDAEVRRQLTAQGAELLVNTEELRHVVVPADDLGKV